ncbi:putative LRR receptor-like serine/threonine-protein kinase [Cinnamomum micranthum f. kanehirae]|uniref:Putative LRR receptor-like serine/threonine-protein kinase n=1 Tax=Cinnamomum micranthum f. kanehirae TaxID=337451 RepID=A0A443NJS6_9MAGN|nr:putative LRR receptor-like serine/threonine-protein kinase [Cinnamomum micranthum f. kanehirae]
MGHGIKKNGVLMKIGLVCIVEYGVGCQMSTKGDVHRFGMLLLEICTRKRPTDDMFKDGLSLHEVAKMALLIRGFFWEKEIHI